VTTEGYKRKLTAILSADVKGYSRLMTQNETATVQTLTAYQELISPLIQKHRGRVVDSPGDNLLAEFVSVVDAVESAVEIQKELKAKNGELPENRRMEFRIGVNLGDVIEEGERIYGDGLNIAARTEGLAEAGGICITGTVYDQVKNKLPLGYEYMGEQSVKNITEPVRVYRVEMEAESSVPQMGTESKVFDKPSIAVLPFVNMSDDPEQEYFSDGITEDLITDLSKVSGLFVIARNSTFTYKGKSVNVQKVGRELGVRYVLEGSVRKAGDRVRITAQLVDATTGGHLWAERYDRDLENIFALQDEVTQQVVSVLAVKVTEDDDIIQSCKCKQPCNIASYDAYLRGLQYLSHFTKEANAQAREMFEKSIDLASDFALAHSRLGDTHLNEWIFGWTQDPQSLEQAFELAKMTIALDDSLSEPYNLLGHVYLWKGQHEEAIAELRKATSLDPNNADGFAGLGSILNWAGRPEEALGMLKKAMHLNPTYPVYYLWSLGHAYFLMERYETAVEAFKKAVNLNPNFQPTRFFLAACYSSLERQTDAAGAAEVIKINPKFNLEHYAKTLPYKNKADKEHYIAALRKAGLE
jgi:adenylate cyclase